MIYEKGCTMPPPFLLLSAQYYRRTIYFPDEEQREAVRQQIHEYIRWGILQKQLQDERASGKEPTK